MARHPELRLVIAHMGMPEVAEFMDLADGYANVMLDTTMAFTDFFAAVATGEGFDAGYDVEAYQDLAGHDRVVTVART